MKKVLLFLLISTFSFGQILTNEENELIALYMSREFTKKEQKELESYMNKKFVNSKVFMTDTEVVVKKALFIPLEDDGECLGRLIASAERDNYKFTNRTYSDMWYAARNFCTEYVYPNKQSMEAFERIDMAIPEKEIVLQESHNESSQYLQIKFVKTKKDYIFSKENIKQLSGDNVDYDVNTVLEKQISQDFQNDKVGNYTAFYNIDYLNNKPVEIKLKARLNR